MYVKFQCLALHCPHSCSLRNRIWLRKSILFYLILVIKTMCPAVMSVLGLFVGNHRKDVRLVSVDPSRNTSSGRGGGAKKIRGITVFSYPSPLGGVRPEKKYPTPMCKKVSQPQFFSKEHHQLLFHIV